MRDLDACLEIVRQSPEYFGDGIDAQVQKALGRHNACVMSIDDELIGFIVVDKRSALAAEILWMAVHPARRNAGHGTHLLDVVLGTLHDEGVALVEVKTLDRTAEYEPYEATRAFLERQGFVQIDTIDPLPGWEPGNPSALYVAALQTTRPKKERASGR